MYEKNIPEFRNNIIVLDGDVPKKEDYKNKSKIVNDSDNIMFLPLVIEKDLFILLKDNSCFNEFKCSYIPTSSLNYDICFSEWPLNEQSYKTLNFKKWFEKTEMIIGDQTILYNYWCYKNPKMVREFVEEFVERFNELAEKKDADELPVKTIINKWLNNKTINNIEY